MTIQAARIATSPARVAVEATLIGEKLPQLISEAALIRFHRALEGRNLALGRLQAALGGLQVALGRLQRALGSSQRALGSSQRARIVFMAALFIGQRALGG